MLAITEKTLHLLRSAQEQANEKLLRQRTERDRLKPRQLNQRRLQELVGKVAAILERGESSKFEFEAACRHGLRQTLCLQGWPWQDADDAGAQIVAMALRRNSAVRPAWKEGQPEWTQDGHSPIERTRCVNCGGNLPPAGNGNERKFCATHCRNACTLRVAKLSGERVSRAEHFARLAADKERRIVDSERDCAYCERPFIPKYRSQRNQEFCSHECYYASTRLALQPCAQCGREFQPTKFRKKYCSTECGIEATRAPPRPCERCGTIFRRKESKYKFCSKSCAMQTATDAAIDRRRPERQCPTCKAIFRVKASSPKTFCSRRCANLQRYRCDEAVPIGEPAPD